MAYTIHQTKTQLSRLVRDAEEGKEVVIMRGKKPVAKIIAITAQDKPELPFRLLGAFPNIQFDDSVFDPLTDEELREFGFDDLADSPLERPAEHR